MKAFGKTTEPMVMEDSYTLMVTIMKDNGLMIKLMALVYTSTQKEQGMKVIGNMINSVDKGLKHGQMVQSSQEIIGME